MTDTRALITWNQLECSERNGVITGYILLLRNEESTSSITITGDIPSSHLSRSLQPETLYFISVAATNIAGCSYFSPEISILTQEKSKSYTYMHKNPYYMVAHITQGSWTCLCTYMREHVYHGKLEHTVTQATWTWL